MSCIKVVFNAPASCSQHLWYRCPVIKAVYVILMRHKSSMVDVCAS
jgi:hypothetical protein